MALFGSGDVMERILSVGAFRARGGICPRILQLPEASRGLQFVIPAIVLRPEINRTHFHLVYAQNTLRALRFLRMPNGSQFL